MTLPKSLRSSTGQLQATSLANNVQEDTIKNLASELTDAKNQAKNWRCDRGPSDNSSG